MSTGHASSGMGLRFGFILVAMVLLSSPYRLLAQAERQPGEGRIAEMLSREVVEKVPPADATPSYRHPDPSQIQAPPGYVVEVFASALDFPVDIAFSDAGDIYIAEAGHHGFGTEPVRATVPQIIQIRPDGTRLTIYENTLSVDQVRQADSSTNMPEGIIPPIKGITWRDGKLYIAHRSRISVLDLSDPDPTTRFRTIVNGLPEWGQFVGGKPIFDRDGKLVFFVSTQGNAGVVDEQWAMQILELNKLKAHEDPG